MNKVTKMRIFYANLAAMLLVMMLLSLTGCDGYKMPENSQVTRDEDVAYTKVMETGTILYTFQDPKTGVWYYWGYEGGMTPRYNKDGSLYCTEIVN